MLIVHLKPSKRLAVALGFAHFSAIALLWPLTLPVMVKLVGSTLLVASLVYYERYYAWLTSPGSIKGLQLESGASDEMSCTLETKSGERFACVLLGSSFVAPYLTVLELRPLVHPKSWRRRFARSIVILPDGIDADEFRRLRVLLRWKWKDPKVKEQKRTTDPGRN
ncbi:protein YgfX [Nitrosovibrio tenuis]|uniref:Toxin CptA n=1 Tax=Nitrosovibrio tenuis TaxID=1233 RepID=A0A1H7IJ58_9PROT|nr:protein YgfX [Nitrosovibrio tenuis]SEK60735.1 toxin CptA [Nitrosovibrio tenuis]